MTTTLPLVRAGAIRPLLAWLRAQGDAVEARLRAAGLPPDLIAQPGRPIGLRAGVRLLVAAARTRGPDLPWRVVDDSAAFDLGLLGAAMLQAATPREALGRAARAMSLHGSHETLSLSRAPGGSVVRYVFHAPLDEEGLHLCQQYVAALVRSVTAGLAARGPRVSEIRMRPHPVHGLAHLEPHCRATLVANLGPAVELVLPDATLDAAYARAHRPTDPAPTQVEPALIRGDGTLAGSIRAILPGLLEGGDCTTATLADLAFMSTRTLQRRLAAEGVHVSGLIDEARRELALRRLAASAAPIEEISVQLGYGSASSFTRAVRRWTGRPPRAMRRS
ncbi:helix-turn-helix domain-containing protein [Amaricoccus sp.]|uniref:AraC family transcriptional regulator n=1 Tax=Amaricoccus sp. TaxID=1872485 RepID=UPI001B719EC3|nr:helix-turn-helix domain-containing protein [Amaricoccus sp.]MBP7000517.1 helix-turn-helix domain-containing protein [Amaricoccus sp.]